MAKDIIIDNLRGWGDSFEKESPAPGYSILDFEEPWNTDLADPDIDRSEKEVFKVKEYGTPVSAWDVKVPPEIGSKVLVNNEHAGEIDLPETGGYSRYIGVVTDILPDSTEWDHAEDTYTIPGDLDSWGKGEIIVDFRIGGRNIGYTVPLQHWYRYLTIIDAVQSWDVGPIVDWMAYSDFINYVDETQVWLVKWGENFYIINSLIKNTDGKITPLLRYCGNVYDNRWELGRIYGLDRDTFLHTSVVDEFLYLGNYSGDLNNIPSDILETAREAVVNYKKSFETTAANESAVKRFVDQAQPGQIWRSRSGFLLALSPNNPVEFERKNDNKLILNNAAWVPEEQKSSIDTLQDFGRTVVDEKYDFPLRQCGSLEDYNPSLAWGSKYNLKESWDVDIKELLMHWNEFWDRVRGWDVWRVEFLDGEVVYIRITRDNKPGSIDLKWYSNEKDAIYDRNSKRVEKDLSKATFNFITNVTDDKRSMSWDVEVYDEISFGDFIKVVSPGQKWLLKDSHPEFRLLFEVFDIIKVNEIAITIKGKYETKNGGVYTGSFNLQDDVTSKYTLQGSGNSIDDISKDIFASKKEEFKDEIFIHLQLPNTVRKRFNHISNLDQDIHMTLVYVPGKKLEEEQKKDIVKAVQEVAKKYKKIKCKFTGIGALDNGDDTVVALVNCKDGAEIYTDLVKALESVIGEFDRKYDFLPHVTLKYEGNGKANLKDLKPFSWTNKELGVKFSDDELYLISLKSGKVKSKIKKKAWDVEIPQEKQHWVDVLLKGPREKLEAELESLNYIIDVENCFSTSDLILRMAIEKELDFRDSSIEDDTLASDKKLSWDIPLTAYNMQDLMAMAQPGQIWESPHRRDGVSRYLFVNKNFFVSDVANRISGMDWSIGQLMQRRSFNNATFHDADFPLTLIVSSDSNEKEGNIKLSAPESYTDKSDIDTDKNQFDSNALFFRQEDHLDINNPEDWLMGENDVSYFPPTKVHQKIDDMPSNADVSRISMLDDTSKAVMAVLKDIKDPFKMSWDFKLSTAYNISDFLEMARPNQFWTVLNAKFKKSHDSLYLGPNFKGGHCGETAATILDSHFFMESTMADIGGIGLNERGTRTIILSDFPMELREENVPVPEKTASEEYDNILDPQPEEVIRTSPTDRKQQYNPVRRKLDRDDVDNFFERGKHISPDKTNDMRSIVPYGWDVKVSPEIGTPVSSLDELKEALYPGQVWVSHNQPGAYKLGRYLHIGPQFDVRRHDYSNAQGISIRRAYWSVSPIGTYEAYGARDHAEVSSMSFPLILFNVKTPPKEPNLSWDFKRVFDPEDDEATYKFDELPEDMQDKVIENYYDINVSYDWWEYTYEDAAEIGLKITGFDLERGSYVEGKLTKSLDDCLKLILNNHGDGTDTYRLAATYKTKLDEIMSRETDDNYYEIENEVDDLQHEFLKELCEKYLSILRHEYEYLTSREAIKETLEANDYDFDLNCKIASDVLSWDVSSVPLEKDVPAGTISYTINDFKKYIRPNQVWILQEGKGFLIIGENPEINNKSRYGTKIEVKDAAISDNSSATLQGDSYVSLTYMDFPMALFKSKKDLLSWDFNIDLAANNMKEFINLAKPGQIWRSSAQYWEEGHREDLYVFDKISELSSNWAEGVIWDANAERAHEKYFKENIKGASLIGFPVKFMDYFDTKQNLSLSWDIPSVRVGDTVATLEEFKDIAQPGQIWETRQGEFLFLKSFPNILKKNYEDFTIDEPFLSIRSAGWFPDNDEGNFRIINNSQRSNLFAGQFPLNLIDVVDPKKALYGWDVTPESEYHVGEEIWVKSGTVGIKDNGWHIYLPPVYLPSWEKATVDSVVYDGGDCKGIPNKTGETLYIITGGYVVSERDMQKVDKLSWDLPEQPNLPPLIKGHVSGYPPVYGYEIFRQDSGDVTEIWGIWSGTPEEATFEYVKHVTPQLIGILKYFESSAYNDYADYDEIQKHVTEFYGKDLPESFGFVKLEDSSYVNESDKLSWDVELVPDVRMQKLNDIITSNGRYPNKTEKKLKHMTTLHKRDDGGIGIKYWDTDVVVFYDDHITLDRFREKTGRRGWGGGYTGNTTVARINEWLSEMNIPGNIFTRKNEFLYAANHDWVRPYRFDDNYQIEIGWDGVPLGGYEQLQPRQRRERRPVERVDQQLDLIAAPDNAEEPAIHEASSQLEMFQRPIDSIIKNDYIEENKGDVYGKYNHKLFQRQSDTSLEKDELKTTQSSEQASYTEIPQNFKEAELDIDYPTVEEIIELHNEIVAQYGGQTGIFAEGEERLAAALGRMQSGMGDQEFYPELVDKAAVLMHSIITTHPFLDGNKRTAFLAGVKFLHLHGVSLEDSDNIAEIIIQVAEGKMTYEQLRDWLKDYSTHYMDRHDTVLQQLSWDVPLPTVVNSLDEFVDVAQPLQIWRVSGFDEKRYSEDLYVFDNLKKVFDSAVDGAVWADDEKKAIDKFYNLHTFTGWSSVPYMLGDFPLTMIGNFKDTKQSWDIQSINVAETPEELVELAQAGDIWTDAREKYTFHVISTPLKLFPTEHPDDFLCEQNGGKWRLPGPRFVDTGFEIKDFPMTLVKRDNQRGSWDIKVSPEVGDKVRILSKSIGNINNNFIEEARTHGGVVKDIFEVGKGIEEAFAKHNIFTTGDFSGIDENIFFVEISNTDGKGLFLRRDLELI